ncbi:myotubularin-related protein 14 isoform X2 [Cataglyphis hispanica]|uniref:myotubularin-related protein 14 isoform X2 n=1 Tax=Cataglyphis hispanica TaxID=1086592 RepID=UPI0021808F15|nr:myotubularin-related protein 14 isoform X2 [Cataglyphis hispanica]
MTEININTLEDLITYFAKNTYKTKDADVKTQEIMQRCMLLTSFDYEYYIIDNNEGSLCGHYPRYLIILEHDKIRSSKKCDSPLPAPHIRESIPESIYLRNNLQKMIIKSRFARCRSRFPVPVILYKGRHVCRSATLASSPEMFGRAGLDFLSSLASSSISSTSAIPLEDKSLMQDAKGIMEESIIDMKNKFRFYDIELLKNLNVGTIIDFMVEKKKVKYGMTVTSSEKVDQERRYSDFNLISLPYPGCEFFKEFRDQDYRSKGLVFDWCQNYVDAPINVPDDFASSQLRINWDRYTEWDLVKLTQNYLRLILRYLSESSKGILIHCISGWDRTPLFISLLRISLWADGVIHKTLNSYQLLYYTIAYDWLLFGHDLADRLNKGEEIFFFCFDFLKYIETEHFSIHKHYERKTRPSESQSENITINAESFELISAPNFSSSSSIEQNSEDGESTAVFFDNLDSQDDSRNNVTITSGTLNVSPNKEDGIIQGSRLSLSANRTSPIGVPIPHNTRRIRQRNDSTSSGDSWQLVTGTDCKPSCAACTTPRTLIGNVNTNDDEVTAYVSSIQRKERLRCLRNIFCKAYGPHGFRLKDEASGIGQYLGNIVGMTSTQRTS